MSPSGGQGLGAVVPEDAPLPAFNPVAAENVFSLIVKAEPHSITKDELIEAVSADEQVCAAIERSQQLHVLLKPSSWTSLFDLHAERSASGALDKLQFVQFVANL